MPTLSLKWLPHSIIGNKLHASFLVGTNGDINRVKLMSLDLPSNIIEDQVSDPFPLYSGETGPIKTEREWVHPGEVNKIDVNSNGSHFATHTNSGDVLIYDLSKENNTQVSTLKYHTKEGFGLEWHSDSKRLLSTAEDSHIALWDLTTISNTSKPQQTFNTHEGNVNDISWNKSFDTVFASVSDDSTYQIHDTRYNSGPIIHVTAVEGHSLTSVDFNSEIPTLFATGSTDCGIQLWDLRNPTVPLRKLQAHTGGVTGLEWKENWIMSWGLDRRVMIWDVNKLDEGEVDRRKSEVVDPCLRFVHGGHTGKVLDAGWGPGVIVSADDTLIEVWGVQGLDEEYTEEIKEE